MGRNGPWIGGKLTERPAEIFRRHIRVAPYPRMTSRRSPGTCRTWTCLVMGSDFPHAEGLAEPAEFAALLDGLTGGGSGRSCATTPPNSLTTS